MSVTRNLSCFLTLSALSLFSNSTYADGLTDLNNALTKLNGDSAISATLETGYEQKRGRKKKVKITTGLAKVQLVDDMKGLQITYSNETLAQLESEENEKESDEEANTPTLNAINDIEASELRNMLSASADLNRTLIKAQFVKEEVITYQDKDARILHFDLPLEAIISDKDVRSYVNDFEGKYNIIIDKNGIPLQAELSFEGSGRAYIFFSLSISQSKTYFYQVIGDRLVNHRTEYDRKQKSTWAQRDSSGYTELLINEKVKNIAQTGF